MSIFPLCLQNLGDEFKPDPSLLEGYTPAPDHVMSRDINGNVASVFGDPSWDYTAYKDQAMYHIQDFIDEISSEETHDEYMNEIKIILFRFIYNGQSNSLNTISELFTVLKRHFRIAVSLKLSFKESLKKKSTLDAIVYDAKLNKRQIGRRLSDTQVLFSRLHFLSQNLDDFEFFPSENISHYLEQLRKEYPYILQQTPVIPTRILSHRIHRCFEYIERFLELKEQFSKLYQFRKTLLRDLVKNGYAESHIKGEISRGVSKEIMINSEYKEFREFFGVKDYRSLRGVVGKVRVPMLEMIHAFSGMRIGESTSIAMDGFWVKTIGRNKVSLIRSYTTKMAKDHGYFADWVTTPEIEKVFEAGRVLNYAILSGDFDIDPDEVDESSVPLFLRSDFGNTSKNNGAGGLFQYPVSKPTLSGWDNHPINKDPEFILTKEDMAEIFAIDPAASPESLKSKANIEIGKPFNFQTHMYRRSLAVYTARSGLVSLPTLKKQLKHLKVQTSAYYGNDAVFAKNFILPKSDDQAFDSAIISQRGFIKEFQDELTEGQVDLLFDEVITADQIVFGGMGTQIQKQKISGTLPTVLTDREKTKKKVKQGRLRYAETPLGGCMATEVCERIAFSSITTCVGCGSSVFINRSVPLLEKTKNEYQSRLAHFGTGTPYGKQLERDIRDIETTLKMREKLISIVDITDGKQ